MSNKQIKIYLNLLREGIKDKNWNKIEYVEKLFNMHTINL